MTRRAFVWCLTLALAVLAGPTMSLAADDAQAVFKATGVRGGPIVQIGAGEGTAADRAMSLAEAPGCLLHVLDADAAKVAALQARLRKAGVYGKATAGQWTGKDLPFIDNVVALLIAEDPQAAPATEAMRVLRPGGVAYVKKAGAWTKTAKPLPTDTDDWTHYLQDASNNAVAADSQVGPPRHMQWLAAPLWTRNHHKLASISSVVSTRGRLFYILDEATGANMKVPGEWSVLGRDAFSGVLLWQRKMTDWASTQHGFRSGPVQLPRTLVADGERLYVPLGLGEPVSALDAATGKTIKTYSQTKFAEEVVCHEGVLLVVAGTQAAEHAIRTPKAAPKGSFPDTKKLLAIQPDTGKTLWSWTDSPTGRLMPVTLAAAGQRVYVQAGTSVLCLGLADGKRQWLSPPPKPQVAAKPEPAGKTPKAGRKAKTATKKKPRRKPKRSGRSEGWAMSTLVVADGVALLSQGGKLQALDAATGKLLWDCPSRGGFRSPNDVFVIDGLVWLGSAFSEGRDLHTGEVKKTTPIMQQLRTVGHHHRCYREKATSRYILSGYRGIEMMDLQGEHHSRNNWVRGVCQYGIMPCNGLIYSPAHTCGCYIEGKIYGFWSLAPASQSRASAQQPDTTPRLTKGPAYGAIDKNDGTPSQSGDWPTYRHDALRSGATPSRLGDVTNVHWQVKVGGRLTAPVVANGTAVLASIDQHRVVALDTTTGKIKWDFTPGGRVDSPPTLHGRTCLFGSADGYVYCLRQADGALVWKLRAAPRDRRTVALDRIESLWPVHGSVLVDAGPDGKPRVWCTAGRNSYVDGGIALLSLDPATGKVLSETPVRNRHPKGIEGIDNPTRKKWAQNALDGKSVAAPDKSDGFSFDAARSDVLVSDGHSVYLRQIRFNRDGVRQATGGRHVLCTTRMLEDSEIHRTHWLVGTGDFSGLPVAYSWIANSYGSRYGAQLSVPYGLMLAYDASTIYLVRVKNGYTLAAVPNKPFSPDEQPKPDFRSTPKTIKQPEKWTASLGLRPRAMIRTAGKLVLAGMPSTGADGNASFDAFLGQKGGTVWVMATKDGAKLAERKLPAPPVWDGLAVTGGRLYVAATDGTLYCLGGEK